MKKVIITTLSDYSSDSRIYKHAFSLSKAGYEVVVLAIWGKDLAIKEKQDNISIERFYFPILKRLGFPFHKRKLLLPFYSLMAIKRIFDHKPDFIQCERVYTIHLGLIYKWFWRKKFVYDSEELAAYWPMMINAKKLTRKLLIAYEKFVSKRAAFVIQTTESRAKQFYKQTGVSAIIIMNKPMLSETNGTVESLAKKYHRDKLKVVGYVGSIMPGRGIENVAEAVADIKRVKLVLLGPIRKGGGSIIKKYNGVIDWIPPVSPESITCALAGIDIGVSLVENTCLSYYYSCPSKVFELIVSGVPQLGSDFPEFRKIIRENGVGPVGRLCDPDNPEEVKSELRLMLSNPDELAEYRTNAIKLRDKCVWAGEQKKLFANYNRILDD